MLLPRSAGGDEIEPWIYLRAIEEISRYDGSVGWNLFVANSAALIAPFIPLSAAKAIYDDPRGWIAWGPPKSIHHECRSGRVSYQRPMAFRQRLAASHLDGRTWSCDRARWFPPAQPVRPADGENITVSQTQQNANQGLGHARYARHRLRGVSARRPVRAGRIHRHA